MRGLVSKFKLLARLRKRKPAAADTLAEEIVTQSSTAVSDGGEPGKGKGDGLDPGTLHSDQHQQQPQPRVGNNTAVEIAPSGSANETNGPSQADTQVIPRATLEALPAKLRCQVLSHISDLEDLRALVLASPVFYEQYLLDREGLLRRALKSTLGNSLVDAYAVQRSAWLDDLHDGPGPIKAEDIKLFLEKYTGMRTAPPDVILEEFIEEDLLDMAGFYHALARPLVLQCATLFRHNLDPSLQDECCPSKTEQMRLLRALYRFQIYCNLFGAGTWGHREGPPLGDDYKERLALFFCVFRPWEIEEIDCVYTLVSDGYEQVFEAIRWDVCRDHPKFNDWRRPDTPPGAFALDNAFWRDCLREGTASRGLRLFHKVLRTQDHDKLVHRMQKYMVLCPEFQFKTVLGWTNQCNRRERYPMEGDLLEDRRERFPFHGDTEDGPPLAWVTEWRGRYSNSYGGAIPASLKKWGHVFWDRERLVGSKGMENVLRERERMF